MTKQEGNRTTNGKIWDKTQDWFWEGNVQGKIVEYMKKNEGFRIVKMADPKRKKRGPDILAERRLSDGNIILRRVEVKGYPSHLYMEGKRKGQKKRTNPSTQARHWFGEAFLELILAKSKDEKIQTTMGFPNHKVYRRLLNKIRWFRKKTGLLCYLVDENGKVRLLLHDEDIPLI